MSECLSDSIAHAIEMVDGYFASADEVYDSRASLEQLALLHSLAKTFPNDYEKARRKVYGDEFVDACKRFWDRAESASPIK